MTETERPGREPIRSVEMSGIECRVNYGTGGTGMTCDDVSQVEPDGYTVGLSETCDHFQK